MTSPGRERSAVIEATPVGPKTKLQVSALRSGTVMDHLDQGTALDILVALGLTAGATVLVGIHLPSGKLGAKDLIKVEGVELTPDEIDRVAVLAPHASFSIIRDYTVVKKLEGRIPDTLEGWLRCGNPACITTDGRVAARFDVERREPLRVRCVYCERSFARRELILARRTALRS